MIDINKRFEDLETRIIALENLVSKSKPIEKHITSSSKGPTNAIHKIIQEGFFDTPKSAKEAKEELERQGYYYTIQVVDGVLRRLNGDTLTRIGKRGQWKYVIRK